MTTDLEKHFFDTFGIEPKPLFSTRNGYTDDHYIYPTITDTHYLELICIFNQVTCLDVGELYLEKLKSTILTECINALNTVDWEYSSESKEDIINEVQALFEE